jgi:hypothetical protein
MLFNRTGVNSWRFLNRWAASKKHGFRWILGECLSWTSMRPCFFEHSKKYPKSGTRTFLISPPFIFSLMKKRIKKIKSCLLPLRTSTLSRKECKLASLRHTFFFPPSSLSATGQKIRMANWDLCNRKACYKGKNGNEKNQSMRCLYISKGGSIQTSRNFS